MWDRYPIPNREETARRGPLTFLRRFRQMLVDLAIVAVVIGILAAVVPSLLRPTVVIDAINVPLSLEERGYSGDVVARRLRDELRLIFQKARPTILTSLKLSDVAVEQRLPDVEAPGGLNLRFFIAMLREHLNLDDIRVTGELTVDRKSQPPKPVKRKADDEEEPEEVEPPPTFVLKLRSRNAGPFYQTIEPTEDLQSIFKDAAVAVLELSNPVLAGRHYETSRQYDDAERLAGMLIASVKPGEHAAGLILRGNVQLRRGDYDRAIADYERVLVAEPTHALAAVNIAWAHRRAERHDATIAAADRAIAIDPKAASAYAHKSAALRLMGRAPEAAAVALIAVDFEPSNGQPLTALAAAYNAMRRSQDALDAGYRSLQRDPNYGATHLTLGFTLQQLGRHPEALDRFKRGADLDPTWARGWIVYGTALRRARQLPEATEAFGKAAAADPKRPEFQFEYGAALVELKRHGEALPALERAIAAGFKPSQTALLLARCHLAAQRYDEALAGFERSAAADPRNDAAWREWGAALLGRKRHGEAAAMLERAREKLPGNAELARLHGDALVAHKARVKAIDAYEAALTLDATLRPALEPVLVKLRRRHVLVSARAAP